MTGNIVRTVSIIAASLVAVPLVAIGVTATTNTDKPVEAVLTTYHYDRGAEKWIRDVQKVVLETDTNNLNGTGSAVAPGNTRPQGSNTLIINLDDDNPVKQIVIFEALITGANATQPLLEIAGHDSGGSGKINIGMLLFKKVDAEELKIDADVVRVQIQNVVAEDNELDLDLDAVNVVRTARGGPSTLLIGIKRSELADVLDRDLTLVTDTVILPNENGVRIDRIRILGPSSGTAFVENITILRTGVLGKIEVKDVRIQDLILRDVTVDDSLP